MKAGYDDLPKPMVLVNGKPLIWHVMNIYSKYGFNEFILPLGYGGGKIKEYFINYKWKNSNLTKDFENNRIEYLNDMDISKWKVTFIDTGINTMTGGRIKKIQPYIQEDTFMMTYADGLSDINIANLLDLHIKKNTVATVTAVDRKSQFGILQVKDEMAKSFGEKSTLDGLINGGFFVLNKKIFNYLTDDNCIFEEEPLRNLVKEQQLSVYTHKGYWKAVDTQKDLKDVSKQWKN
jgi:glucose-1-phosphate cytidylyltransferase